MSGADHMSQTNINCNQRSHIMIVINSPTTSPAETSSSKELNTGILDHRSTDIEI